MVLVDTSVWVRFLREGDRHLAELLDQGIIVCHPFIIGELACGRIHNRREILGLLQALPSAEVLQQSELLQFIERHGLMGTGLGFVDVHLLASAILTGVSFWTHDKRLKRASFKLGVGYTQ
jgi:hypothetical protein